MAGPEFASAWNRALQVAHQQVMTVLAGDASAISIKNGMAVLDVGVSIDAAKQQLVKSGFTAAGKIPEVHPTIPLFPAEGLVRAQTAYQILNAVASWLPRVTWRCWSRVCTWPGTTDAPCWWPGSGSSAACCSSRRGS